MSTKTEKNADGDIVGFIKEEIDAASEKVENLISRVKELSTDAQENLKTRTKKEPMKFLSIAFGVGVAVGLYIGK